MVSVTSALQDLFADDTCVRHRCMYRALCHSIWCPSGCDRQLLYSANPDSPASPRGAGFGNAMAGSPACNPLTTDLIQWHRKGCAFGGGRRLSMHVTCACWLQALNGGRRLVAHHANVLGAQLHSFVLLALPSVEALRSTTSRTGMLMLQVRLPCTRLHASCAKAVLLSLPRITSSLSSSGSGFRQESYTWSRQRQVVLICVI